MNALTLIDIKGSCAVVPVGGLRIRRALTQDA